MSDALCDVSGRCQPLPDDENNPEAMCMYCGGWRYKDSPRAGNWGTEPRADLATPDPMDDPRVKALVEALKNPISPFDWETADMFYKRLREFNTAALAAMKGGA